MFDFRNGMLGVVIVSLALGGAIFGAYFAGIESVEHEVVKYNELADVTGLFDTDKSPQYIDYDPSTNYVGYYSQESYSEEMDQYYFAEDQVGFTPNEKDGKPLVNNYRIDREPTISPDNQLDFTTIQPEYIERNSYFIRYVYDTEGHYVVWSSLGTTQNPTYTLKSVLEEMNLDSSWTNVRFNLSDDVNWDDDPTYYPATDKYQLELDAVFIIPERLFEVSNRSIYTVYVANPLLNRGEIQNVSHTVNQIYQSFDVNLKTWSVKCYVSNDYTGYSVELQADSLIVADGRTSESIYNLLYLSSTLDYHLLEFPEQTYLNPNEGVYLKGDE